MEYIWAYIKMADNNPWSGWMGDTVDNPYMRILEESPSAAYHSYQSDWNTPAQTQYYQNQFQNVYNQYLGTLGSALRQGATGQEGALGIPEISQMTFADYLGDYDWTNRFTSLPPAMRGDYSAQFNPRTRSIYF